MNPQAPVHILLIPKIRDGLTQLSQVLKSGFLVFTPQLYQAEERHKEILGHLMYTAQLVAKEQGIQDSGFRIVVNDGKHGCNFLI